MDKKYDMLVSALDAIAFSRESDPVKLKNMAREALKGFNSRPTPRALDECHRCGANLVTESSVHDGSVYCTACGTRQ